MGFELGGALSLGFLVSFVSIASAQESIPEGGVVADGIAPTVPGGPALLGWTSRAPSNACRQPSAVRRVPRVHARLGAEVAKASRARRSGPLARVERPASSSMVRRPEFVSPTKSAARRQRCAHPGGVEEVVRARSRSGVHGAEHQRHPDRPVVTSRATRAASPRSARAAAGRATSRRCVRASVRRAV